MTARGRFITFEGGEGSGKSTQVKRLQARLAVAGIDVVATREPGGAPGAEQIRTLLVTGDAGRWDALTETLLHFAARRQHLVETVWPALDRGAWVLSDRFADSTRAYQGGAQGVPPDRIETLYELVAGPFRPDLTLILDLPVDMGLARAGQRAGNENRYERMGLPFHQRLRDAFLDIAARDPDRCTLVDAGQGLDAVTDAIWTVVARRFNLAP